MPERGGATRYIESQRFQTVPPAVVDQRKQRLALEGLSRAQRSGGAIRQRREAKIVARRPAASRSVNHASLPKLSRP